MYNLQLVILKRNILHSLLRKKLLTYHYLITYFIPLMNSQFNQQDHLKNKHYRKVNFLDKFILNVFIYCILISNHILQNTCTVHGK